MVPSLSQFGKMMRSSSDRLGTWWTPPASPPVLDVAIGVDGIDHDSFLGLPSASTSRIVELSGIARILRSRSRCMEPMMQPPSPRSTAQKYVLHGEAMVHADVVVDRDRWVGQHDV